MMSVRLVYSLRRMKTENARLSENWRLFMQVELMLSGSIYFFDPRQTHAISLCMPDCSCEYGAIPHKK